MKTTQKAIAAMLAIMFPIALAGGCGSQTTSSRRQAPIVKPTHRIPETIRRIPPMVMVVLRLRMVWLDPARSTLR